MNKTNSLMNKNNSLMNKTNPSMNINNNKIQKYIKFEINFIKPRI